MNKMFFGLLMFLFSYSLFAQTDMGRYREIEISDYYRIYILKSQRCADIDAAWDFWSANAFLWGSNWIINNQQDPKDYPNAMWEQADGSMLTSLLDDQRHFDNGVAYIVRTVMNLMGWRLINQRLIYFSRDGKSVWYYYSIASLWEPM